MQLEHLVAKHCERYVNVIIERIQDKHVAEIAAWKSELAKSNMEMDVMKTELEKERKHIETLAANIDQSTKTAHFSDSRETLAANIDQATRTEHFPDSRETLAAKIDKSTRTEHFSDSRETLAAHIDQSTRTEHFSDSRKTLSANINQSTRTEHFSDSRETLTANIEKSTRTEHISDSHETLTANTKKIKQAVTLLNSSTEVPVAKIDRQNKPEPDSDSVAEGIQSGETLTRESGSKVAETRNIDDQSALPSKARVRIRRVVHRVAFFAYLTSHAEHLGHGQDIVFDHVVTNIGNAYNAHHGVFVAPAQGTYVFSCTLMDGSAENTWVHFVANNNIVAKFYLPTSEQGSHTIVVTLNAGDDVSVQDTYTNRNIYGDRYSTFSGFLLYGSGGEEMIG